MTAAETKIGSTFASFVNAKPALSYQKEVSWSIDCILEFDAIACEPTTALPGSAMRVVLKVRRLVDTLHTTV